MGEVLLITSCLCLYFSANAQDPIAAGGAAIELPAEAPASESDAKVGQEIKTKMEELLYMPFVDLLKLDSLSDIKNFKDAFVRWQKSNAMFVDFIHSLKLKGLEDDVKGGKQVPAVDAVSKLDEKVAGKPEGKKEDAPKIDEKKAEEPAPKVEDKKDDAPKTDTKDTPKADVKDEPKGGAPKADAPEKVEDKKDSAIKTDEKKSEEPKAEVKDEPKADAQKADVKKEEKKADEKTPEPMAAP